MKITVTWLKPPATVILGWSVTRRRHYLVGTWADQWVFDPGWSITLWLGLWNLTVETSNARSTIPNRGSFHDSH
jgi:hypothetical protein